METFGIKLQNNFWIETEANVHKDGSVLDKE